MATTLVTRKARLDDLAEIDTLLGRSYPALLKNSYPPSLLVTAIPLISKAQPGLLASGTYFVVTDDDAIVGAGGWTRAKPGGASGPTSGVAHIRHVVTDHRRTREGIGRHLMAHIFKTAKAERITWLECYSTAMAEPFYASVGFETIGPITVPLRPGIDFPAVHMRRVLA